MKCLSCLVALVLAMLFADTAQAGGFGGLGFRQRSQVVIQRQRVIAPVYAQPVVQFRQSYYAAPQLNFGYQQQFRSLQFNSGYSAPLQLNGGYCDPFAGQLQFRSQFRGY